MPKYLIRLDDACHQSNWDNWDKIQQLFSKYKIKPIVGVIPSNRDQKFKYSNINDLPRIILSVPGTGGSAGLDIEVIIEMWKQTLGIEVEIQQVEWATFLQMLNRQELQFFSGLGWIADYPDPENFLDINFSKKPLMDSDQIMKIIPHRPPFLLIDEIHELSNSHAIGVYNVSPDEAYFEGHFPGSPVMPGVLQIEFMAQTGGVLILGTVPDPENYLTFFMKMDEVKFKRVVNPGDKLICKLELISPIRRGIIHMKGLCFVGDELASEGKFMAKIIKKNK